MGITEGGMSAAAGFQARFLNKNFLIDEFYRIMKQPIGNKEIEYIQSGLRSATDIYKRGGQVVATYKDRKYSLNYDNKRRIIDPIVFSSTNTNSVIQMLDSQPWVTVAEYAKIRVLTKTVSTPVFTRGIPALPQGKGYKSYIETSVRGFIKACLSDDFSNRYGIPKGYFIDYKSIIDFIKTFEPARGVRLSLSSISKLRNRKTITRAVPRTKETEAFANFLKITFTSFESDRFFRELSKDSHQKSKGTSSSSLISNLRDSLSNKGTEV